MKYSARDLAAILNAKVEGDPTVMVSHPSKIEEALPGTISFLGNPKYESYAYTTQASILIVSEDFIPSKPVQATLLRVANVYQSLSFLLSKFDQNGKPEGIAQTADIHSTSKINALVSIGAFSIIEKEVSIGEGTAIYPHVFIGHNTTIGKGCTIYAGVKIYPGCEIGDDVIIHANTVIGSDGFGFVPENGVYKKIPQLGNVIVENHVEIGANCTIDRATMGSTIIHKGVKLDNLIQVAHNVEIGENTVIAAQTGIAGSTKIGARCMIGGGVGIAGHLKVPDDTQIQGLSGIMNIDNVPGQKLFGYPAMPYYDFLKSYILFKKLPEIEKRVRDLEKDQ